MTTAVASSPRRRQVATTMRRLLRTRADRVQSVGSTVLVLATMAACVWIATPDFTSGIDEAASTAQAITPRG
jgi:hypothetical protein